MATTANNVGIVNSWSLISFAKAKGKVQRGTFTNKETGEQFASLIFTNPTNGDRCFVSFSSNLGELSANEVAAQAADLQVVELTSGTYKLCRHGENSWEDINLF